jgi:hypothetical protein
VKWLFTPASPQWRNGRAEAAVKSTKFALRITFKQTGMDALDMITTLKMISGLLNLRPVELMLGAYNGMGKAQELDSLLPEFFTCISANNLLLSAGSPHNDSVNYMPMSGPRWLDHMEKKLEALHKDNNKLGLSCAQDKFNCARVSLACVN